MLKKQVEKLIESPLGDVLLRALKPLSPQRPNELQVLTYHTIDNATGFQEQMRYLAANYQAVAMEDVVEAFAGRRTLPPGAVLITFDDAYCSFAECAWPVMKALGLAATLFVPTSFPDRPERVFWWDCLEHAVTSSHRRDALQSPVGQLRLKTEADRRAAVKRLKRYLAKLSPTEALAWSYELCRRLDVAAPAARVLSWEELRRLKSEGVTLAPHSRTHPSLARTPPQQAREEIVGSLADLERQTGPTLPIFAYPGGFYNEETVAILADADFLLSFTMTRGTNQVAQTHRLKLRRIHIGGDATYGALRARLLYGSKLLNRWQHYRTRLRK